MTLKGFLRAALRAFLAFAIYFGWQIIVVNWAYIAATFVVMPGIDPSALTGADYDSMLIEFQNKAAEIVMNYSMHLTLVSGVLAALTFIIIAKARRRKFLDDLGVKKLPANLIPVLILLGASLNIFVSLALNLIPFPQEWIDSYTESASQLSNGGLIVSTIVTVITAPIVEEMTFRGYMYKGLKTGMPMFAAMLISSWVFGLVHGEVIWVIYASLLGLVFTWTTEKCGSLLASMIVHMTFNLFGVLTQLCRRDERVGVLASARVERHRGSGGGGIHKPLVRQKDRVFDEAGGKYRRTGIKQARLKSRKGIHLWTSTLCTSISRRSAGRARRRSETDIPAR